VKLQTAAHPSQKEPAQLLLHELRIVATALGVIEVKK
jgi:hypothetical protein